MSASGDHLNPLDATFAVPLDELHHLATEGASVVTAD